MPHEAIGLSSNTAFRGAALASLHEMCPGRHCPGSRPAGTAGGHAVQAADTGSFRGVLRCSGDTVGQTDASGKTRDTGSDSPGADTAAVSGSLFFRSCWRILHCGGMNRYEEDPNRCMRKT